MSNYFTYEAPSWELAYSDSMCDHVQADRKLCTTVAVERDSFGIVGVHAMCRECAEQERDRERSEAHRCVDCEKTKQRREGIMWKCYDFYAAQGDEPLFVCHECVRQVPHRRRVAQDRLDRDAEFGGYDD